MRIIIDVRRLLETNEKTGIAFYTENLIRALANIDKQDEFDLLMGASLRKSKEQILGFEGDNINEYFFKMPSQIYNRLSDYRKIQASGHFLGDYDVFHSPNFLCPLNLNKAVVTILDMIVFKYPETYPKEMVFPGLLKKYLPETASRARHIITISEASKKDIVEILGIPESKVSVTYLAADEAFCTLSSQAPEGRSGNNKLFDGPYMAYMGTIEPRKNLKNLIKAFEIVRDRGWSGSLVLIGRKGWLYDDIEECAGISRYSKDIHISGYLEREDTINILKQASVFVYPSLYEGFGLPILEAMLCGVPVVASKTSSIPEIAGDAAILVSPDDIDEIASAIMSVLEDHELASKMVELGIRQAGRFSWEATARKTLDIYRQVAQT